MVTPASLHSRLLRPLLSLCLFLIAVTLPLRAQDWQTLEIRVPAGRAPHTFSLEITGSGGELLWQYGMVWPDAIPLWMQLGAFLDTERDYTLIDETAGDSLPLTGLLGQSVLDLRPSLWDTHGALPRLYFVAQGDRASHTFLLHQPGGIWFEAAGGSLHGPWDRQFSALYDPAQVFRIVDTTTNEMA